MIEVEIEEPAWLQSLPDAEALVLDSADAALSAAVAPPSRSTEGATAGEIVILLADDGALADLNQRFRGKAGPTNVLSFPAPDGARPHLGDIAIAYGVCAREAREQNKRLDHHLMHLVVHGVLHLVGYDHLTESEAEDMEALERQVLEGLGAPDPYQPLAPEPPHGR